MPRYEWDNAKQASNLARHKLSFAEAALVYEHTNKVTVRDPFPDEERYRALAEVNGIVRILVYVMRDSAVRCISYRAASRKERRFYYDEIKAR